MSREQHDVPPEERDRIFAPLSAFPRWRKLEWWQVRHSAGCEGRVAFHSTESERPIFYGEVRELAYAVDQIRGAQLTLVEHRATCPACRSYVLKIAARVEVSIGDGKFVTREYET